MTNNASNTTQLEPIVSALSASPNSRPIFQRKVTLNSLQAKRIIDRSFKKLRHALFQTSVIMKITYSEEEIAAVDSTIDKSLDKEQQDISNEKARIQKLLDDNGITTLAVYTKPEEFILDIDSPRANRFLRLVIAVDELIHLIDTAWLSGEISDSVKKDLTYQQQQRLIKAAGQIIGLESRTRAAAARRGKTIIEEEHTDELTSGIDLELDAEIEQASLAGIAADTKAEKSVMRNSNPKNANQFEEVPA